jgi:hypothetical protein
LPFAEKCNGVLVRLALGNGVLVRLALGNGVLVRLALGNGVRVRGISVGARCLRFRRPRHNG